MLKFLQEKEGSTILQLAVGTLQKLSAIDASQKLPDGVAIGLADLAVFIDGAPHLPNRSKKALQRILMCITNAVFLLSGNQCKCQQQDAVGSTQPYWLQTAVHEASIMAAQCHKPSDQSLFSGWEGTKQSAMLLAELHLDRAASLSDLQKAADKKGNAAAHALPQHMQASQRHLDFECEVNLQKCKGYHSDSSRLQAALSSLGQVGVALLDVGEEAMTPEQQRLQIRYSWAQGCHAELAGNDQLADWWFLSCLDLCNGCLPAPVAEPNSSCRPVEPKGAYALSQN